MISNRRKKHRSFVQVFLALLTICLLGTFALINTVSFISAASVTGFSVSGVSASYTNSGTASWTSTGSSLSGSATGSGGCSSSSSTTTLTLTMSALESNTKHRLSLEVSSVSLNSGTVTIDGSSVSGATTITKDYNNGSGTLAIVITTASGDYTTSLNISSISYIALKEVTVTCLAPYPNASVGTYTVNGTNYSSFNEGNPYSYSTSDAPTFVASASSNYKLYGWQINESSLVSTLTTFKPTEVNNYSIRPYFVTTDTPIFKVSAQYFVDLNDADTYAKNNGNKIILTSNGTISGGVYTISSGNTLLIPHDANYTMITTQAAVYASRVTPSMFSKLTLTNGATINVNGAINVSSKMCSTGQASGSNGCPTGPYGQIHLSEGTVINLVKASGQSTSPILYAWGFVSGSGIVHARNGTTVWEMFQIKNWRGGTATSNMNDNSQKVFPINQYYVQNVEAALRIYYGAQLKVATAVNASSSAYDAVTDFIGVNGMLKLTTNNSSHYVEKKYEGATDRIIYTTNGDVTLSSFNLNISLGFYTAKLSTANYVLPLNNNMSIVVESGTLKVDQEVCFMPGSKAIIYSGSEVDVSEEIYLYDMDQWQTGFVYGGGNGGVVVSGYSTVNGTTAKRNGDELTDAEIDLNGTLTVNTNGAVYTSSGGSNVHSSQTTGKFVYAIDAPSSTTTYQATQNGTSVSYTSIAVTAAMLKNGENAKKVSSTGTTGYGGLTWADVDAFCETSSATKGTQFSLNSDLKQIATNLNDTANITEYAKEQYCYWANGAASLGGTIKYYVNGVETNFGAQYASYNFGSPFTFPTVANAYKWISTDLTSIFDNGEYIPSMASIGSQVSFNAFFGGWMPTSEQAYVLRDNGEYAFGLVKMSPGDTKTVYGVEVSEDDICLFETGGLLYSTFNGILSYSSDTYPNGDNQYYLLEKGIVQQNYGLYCDSLGSYYYFGNSNFAYKEGTFYVSQCNGLQYNNNDIQPGYYYFDEYGVMDIDHSHSEPKDTPTYVEGGVAYVTYDTQVADNYGLFAYNNNLYYAGANGVLVTSTSFYVGNNMINGCTIGSALVTEGLYYFDEYGRMYDSQLNLITNGGQSA